MDSDSEMEGSMASQFTAVERCVVDKILREVNDKMEWNESSGEYEDNGGIIISLEKEEKAALSRALRKI